MTTNIVYVPYDHDLPAAIEIKGHKLIFAGTNKDDLIDSFEGLELLKKENLRLCETSNHQLVKLAEQMKAGIVVPAPGESFSELILNLEKELPWLN